MGSHSISRRSRPPHPIIAELERYAVMIRAHAPTSRGDREVSAILAAYENGLAVDPVSTIFASALYLHERATTGASYTLDGVAFDLLAISRGRPCPEWVGYYEKGDNRNGLAFGLPSSEGEDQQSSGPAMPKRLA